MLLCENVAILTPQEQKIIYNSGLPAQTKLFNLQYEVDAVLQCATVSSQVS